MLKRFLVLGLLVSTVLFGCEEDDSASFNKPTNSTLVVRVVHPTLGDGPNFLVKYYQTLEDLQRNVPTRSAITTLEGIVVFDRLATGESFVETIVAGDPQLFDRDTFLLPFNDTTFVTLNLAPQP